jgi:hypothetical protein
MLFEMSGYVSLVDLVVALDYSLYRRLTTFAQIDDFLRSRPVPSRLKLALTLASSASESPQETRLRLLMHFAGLPTPAVNMQYGGDSDLTLRRYDFSWVTSRLIVEYDGRHHISREAQWHADLKRREEAEAVGWRVIVCVAPDIFVTPGETIARIHHALAERGEPGTPSVPSDEWRKHFIVRCGL